jgi:hypothetical protein
MRHELSVRDTVWQILFSLDSGTLSPVKRVYAYTSIALFLEEEDIASVDALNKAKHIILQNGGRIRRFERDMFHFFPIRNMPYGSTLSILAIGEDHFGLPLRNKSLSFILVASEDPDRKEQFEARLNQCGVIDEKRMISEEIFPEPMPVTLYITSENIEGKFDLYREFISDFELLSE